MSPTEPTLATLRYRALVQQLLDEGLTQSEVGEKLGVYQTFVSKVKRGEAEPGQRAISKAIESLDLEPSFFFDPGLEDPSYRRYIRVPDVGDADTPNDQAFEDFLHLYSRRREIGREALEWLRSCPWPVDADALSYMRLAEAYLAGLERGTPEPESPAMRTGRRLRVAPDDKKR